MKSQALYALRMALLLAALAVISRQVELLIWALWPRTDIIIFEPPWLAERGFNTVLVFYLALLPQGFFRVRSRLLIAGLGLLSLVACVVLSVYIRWGLPMLVGAHFFAVIYFVVFALLEPKTNSPSESVSPA